MDDVVVLADFVDRSLTRVLGDLERARSIAQDAMAKLFSSFSTLHDHLAAERISYEAAIQAIAGNGTDTGLVSAVREILGRFVEDLRHISTSSTRIMAEVAALQGHAGEVASRGNRIEKIAQTSHVIALNARIEANRVGAAGTVFRIVADEIKALAHETGELSKAIRVAIQAQARSIAETQDAAQQLAATDLGEVVQSHDSLEGMIEQLSRVSRTSTDALIRIQGDVDQAIQALQFEDMLTQLLSAISGKLDAVRGACATVRDGGSLAALEQATQTVGRDVVAQRDLAAGNVDLF